MRNRTAAATVWGCLLLVLLFARAPARGEGGDANTASVSPADDGNTASRPSACAPPDRKEEARSPLAWQVPTLYWERPRLDANQEEWLRWQRDGQIPKDEAPHYATERGKDLYWLAHLLRGDPGPEMPHRFDTEVYHWLDWERLGNGRPSLEYASAWYPSAVTDQPGQDFGLVRQNFVAHIDPILASFVRLSDLQVLGQPRLPQTGGRLPSNLSNMQAGFAIPVPGFWSLANVTFGSASDRPFGSADEMTMDVTWFTGEMQGPGWGAYINWQNNRDYLNGLPIPGFVYRYKQGNWFTWVAGFPDNAIAWRPVEWLELSGEYTFPRTVRTEIGVRPIREIKLFSGFDWTHDSFFRHDRQDKDDRLWYFEKTVGGGVRWEHENWLFLELKGGWAFDRFWFEGQRYEDRSFNRINVADGPFLGLTFGVRF
jgi:hypothetical protein